MSEQDKDQRTELPTPQRLRRAFSEGNVAVSSELMSSITLVVGVLFFLFAGNWFFANLATTYRNRLTFFDAAIFDPGSIRILLASELGVVGKSLLALLLPVFFGTALVGALQTNFNLSFKPLELKWDKFDVSKGVKRIVSPKGLVRGAMAVGKTVAIVVAATFVVNAHFSQIANSGTFTFAAFMYQLANVILQVSIASVAIIALISFADLAYQKWKHVQDLKMSIRDIRDENKEAEGDPQIRARIKRLQNQLGRERIVEQVASASVVVTNPTHFAVALQYNTTTMIAPKVVAKGTDHLAKKIIEVAKENNIPVVERKPVARFLYFNINVGKSIPPELYAAVAEILNFVNRVNKSKRWMTNESDS